MKSSEGMEGMEGMEGSEELMGRVCRPEYKCETKPYRLIFISAPHLPRPMEG